MQSRLLLGQRLADPVQTTRGAESLIANETNPTRATVPGPGLPSSSGCRILPKKPAAELRYSTFWVIRQGASTLPGNEGPKVRCPANYNDTDLPGTSSRSAVAFFFLPGVKSGGSIRVIGVIGLRRLPLAGGPLGQGAGKPARPERDGALRLSREASCLEQSTGFSNCLSEH